MIIIFCLLMEKNLQIKADSKKINFATWFYLGIVSDVFDTTESKELSLKWNFYDFSVDCSPIDNSDIFNILMYLTVKNNIK